jgi:hypothetical protein
MDEGLSVKPNVTLAPTKRFFRVGTAEVICMIMTHKMLTNKTACMKRSKI